MASLPRRLRNLAVRTLNRLPPPALAVSPRVGDDLFEAHRALYRFAGSFASGRRCLDLGCGTGYGTHALVEAGAREALGVELDPRAVGFARRRFAGPAVRFEQADAATFSALPASFDLVVAANVLVHLREAPAVLRRLAEMLGSGGLMVASVPPILDGQTMDLHRTLPRHASNLYLWDWEDAFKAAFGELRLFRQAPPEGRQPKLGDSAPAGVTAEEYRFDELALADLYDVGTLAAVFVAGAPRQG